MLQVAIRCAPGCDKGALHKGRPHREVGGGSPKADIAREVAWIYSYRSSQNADKGGRENFADVLYVWSLRRIAHHVQ